MVGTFTPFTSVRDLFVSEQVAPCVAPALRELTDERVTEVLPALQNLFLVGFQVSTGGPGGHWTVCCRATVVRSSCGYPP